MSFEEMHNTVDFVQMHDNTNKAKELIALLVMMGFKHDPSLKREPFASTFSRDYTMDKWFLRFNFIDLRIDLKHEDSLAQSSHSLHMEGGAKRTLKRILTIIAEVEESM